MNTFYSEMGRKFEAQTPIAMEGCYLLHGGGEVSRSPTAPEGVPTITAERFLEALVEGCKTIIRTFAERAENKEVYAFNLCADEYNSFHVYMNTEECFAATLARYGRLDPEEIRSLKYSLGDFEYHFWEEQMGEHGEPVALFETIAYGALDLDEDHDGGEAEGEPVAAIEAGIVYIGYQVLALQAVQRLIADDAFAPLHKSAAFAAYAATGNEYFDYSIVMRKTIEPGLFEAIFPDLSKLDRQYRHELESYRTLSVSEALDYWLEAVRDGYRSVSPYCYIKSEYEVFKQLAPFGNALADASLPRLRKIVEQDDLVHDDLKQVYYYIECLHFAGEFTSRQQEECRSIAALLGENHEEMKAEARELLRLANRQAS